MSKLQKYNLSTGQRELKELQESDFDEDLTVNSTLVQRVIKKVLKYPKSAFKYPFQQNIFHLDTLDFANFQSDFETGLASVIPLYFTNIVLNGSHIKKQSATTYTKFRCQLAGIYLISGTIYLDYAQTSDTLDWMRLNLHKNDDILFKDEYNHDYYKNLHKYTLQLHQRIYLEPGDEVYFSLGKSTHSVAGVTLTNAIASFGGHWIGDTCRTNLENNYDEII